MYRVIRAAKLLLRMTTEYSIKLLLLCHAGIPVE